MLPSVPPLPCAFAHGDSVSKSADFATKLPRGFLLQREDSLIFTPRPIKAAGVDAVGSPTDPASPSNSDNSYSSSYSYNSASWPNRAAQLLSLPLGLETTQSDRSQASPFVNTSSRARSSPYTQGQLLALVEQALSGPSAHRELQPLRRVYSAPLLDSVPEEHATLKRPTTTFAQRPAFSTEYYNNASKVAASVRTDQQLQKALSEPVRPNVVKSVVVTPTQEELEAIFQDPEEIVVCEIRIPDQPAAAGSSGLSRVRTTFVFTDNWQMPLEEFPFSPKPGTAASPFVSAFGASPRAQASCGLFQRMFRWPSSQKLKAN